MMCYHYSCPYVHVMCVYVVQAFMFYVNFSINDGENISVGRVLSFVFKTCIRIWRPMF